eukprot:m.165282 g.165282  ORF g.165282 m.165282 type:complete len:68 (-) comp16589_c1_seq16:1558-1761(-)
MSSCDTDIWIYIPRLVFDPFDLALDVTPANVVAALDRRDFLQALVLAFRYKWLVVHCCVSSHLRCLV